MRALLAALALLVPVVAAAEGPEPISPDRAGFSTSTSTVGGGAFQLEAGLAYGRQRFAGGPPERRFNVDLLARVGVIDRLEIALLGEPLVHLRNDVNTTDVGNFTVGAKWRFFEPAEGSPAPSLGLLPFVKLPVAEEPIGSGKTDFGLALLASFDLPAGFGVDLNAGMAAIGQSNPGGYRLQALVAAGLSYELTEAFTLFTDLFYASKESRGDRYGVVLDAGVLWRLTRDLALDLSGVASLAGTGPDWLVRGGVSVRFGR